MPKALTLGPTIHSYPVTTALLGTADAHLTANDTGKAVKLIGPDRYDLCAAGDKIEGIITSVESAYASTSGGNSWGGVVTHSPSMLIEVTSAAALVVGDLVVAAAQPAKGTPLVATQQAGIQPIPVQKAAAGAVAPFLWRIVGFSGAADGAAGNVCIAQAV